LETIEGKLMALTKEGKNYLGDFVLKNSRPQVALKAVLLHQKKRPAVCTTGRWWSSKP
jgi:hypothetical protein